MKKTLIILTDQDIAFPFLEFEISYSTKARFSKIIVLSEGFSSVESKIPPDITLIRKHNPIPIFFYSIKSLFSSIFWKELKLLTKDKVFIRKSIIALKDLSGVFWRKKLLKDVLKKIEGEVVIYSFWNDLFSYSACLLKRKNENIKLVSRVHRFDLFLERRIFSYMPFKWQFVNDFNVLFFLSDSSLSYYKNSYKPKTKLKISRLGIQIPSISKQNYSYNEKVLRILSLSNCVSVKQIHKTTKALALLAKENTNLKVKWTHIGGGPLLEILKEEANTFAINHSNFIPEFTGFMPNEEVQNLLQNNSYDIFINSSLSEGTPVSIMEAMSYGIPVIAPNVGAMEEILTNKNGVLLNETIEPEDIYLAIKSVLKEKILLSFRKEARKMVEEKFDSNKNYLEFYTELYNL